MMDSNPEAARLRFRRRRRKGIALKRRIKRKKD